MSHPHKTALVMGGSLGGLFAALFLEQEGFHVTVLERSSKPLFGKGAGIALHPSTERFFKLHTRIPLSRISVQTSALRYVTSPSSPLPIPCRYRLASYNTLLSSLLAHLSSDRYLLNSEVISVSQTHDSVTVTTSTGKQYTASLLICADGTSSHARSLLFDSHTTTNYAGYIAWRGVTDHQALPPYLSEQLRDSILLHPTNNGHHFACPIPATTSADTTNTKVCTNWLWYQNVPTGEHFEAIMTDNCGQRRERSVPMGKVRQSLVDKLRKQAEDVPEPFRSVIKATEQPFIQAIYDVESTRMVCGRACLLGDAAFTVRPHTAVGTAKAAEDAWQLAKAVAELGVVDGLLKYEKKQLELGRDCLTRSREVGDMLQGGRWKVGRKLAFGLFQEGDSEVVE